MSTFNNQFGLLIAFLLPGFIALGGIAPFAPVVAAWFVTPAIAQASLGPPLYAILAATSLGIILSSFRWLIIDHIHAWTGVKPPVWEDSQLAANLTAFNYVVENHYRYYQFVANALVAILWTYSVHRWLGTSHRLGFNTDVAMLILCVTLFAASRDALSKYYQRTEHVLTQNSKKGFTGDRMFNGNHADGGANANTPNRPDPKPQPKKESSDKTVDKEAGKPKSTK